MGLCVPASLITSPRLPEGTREGDGPPEPTLVLTKLHSLRQRNDGACFLLMVIVHKLRSCKSCIRQHVMRTKVGSSGGGRLKTTRTGQKTVVNHEWNELTRIDTNA